MADNRLPERNLPVPGPEPDADRLAVERRKLLRRAAVGLPVILATVHGRTVWARRTNSCAHSTHPSGCANRKKLN
jgi:hypothetical protein